MADTNDLLYMRARYYVPSIGRFINKDLVEDLNRYIYVLNNPIRNIDPRGLQLEEIIGASSGIEIIIIGTAIYVTMKLIIDNIFGGKGACMFSKKETIKHPDGGTTEIKWRSYRGRDGARSRTVKERDSAGNYKEGWHEVYDRDGNLIHRDPLKK